jgi:hypothetical protein
MMVNTTARDRLPMGLGRDAGGGRPEEPLETLCRCCGTVVAKGRLERRLVTSSDCTGGTGVLCRCG